ncbi:peptide-methionine (R)-S-oxide reductase MsrB [Aquisalimonas asiatica]|uniref:peptide-methionine (R)-S-oxide reductase n=1 Tax=Aquisalimonas asiatica TaxID=406100 RepID=A0A1H8QY06_9GAMM|nr:peptide-methionine (R)-S-oxide reductase MsrB [Aquisalimonas asiatica]SEO58891.1 peptide-methionine (R)-S-oxide reductase [Aquisalimonas asiatica]
MKRRRFIGGMSALGVLSMLPSGWLAARADGAHHDVAVNAGELERLSRSADAWRAVLSDDAWQVLFRERTEPSFSSPLDSEYGDGTYVCAACHLPLFSSGTKFDSRTGWPSFYEPLQGHVDTKLDFRLIWPRTEYHCIRCGGHQGHVFNDGPEPTGERWCNNGLALRFVRADEPLPDLRGRET